MQIYIF